MSALRHGWSLIGTVLLLRENGSLERERTGWPRPINRIRTRAEQRAVTGPSSRDVCSRAGVQVMSARINVGAISVALYWTQEKGVRGKDKGKPRAIFLNELGNCVFPLGNELFLSLCAAALWSLMNSSGRWENTIIAALLFQWKLALLNVTVLQLEV